MSDLCLHCELSEVLMRRQAAGEPVTEQTIADICQVIADIAASQPDQATRLKVMSSALGHLTRFSSEILAGTYAAGAEISDPNNVRQHRRH